VVDSFVESVRGSYHGYLPLERIALQQNRGTFGVRGGSFLWGSSEHQ